MGYRESCWDDSMKVIGIFGALPGSKELLLLVKEYRGRLNKAKSLTGIE